MRLSLPLPSKGVRNPHKPLPERGRNKKKKIELFPSRDSRGRILMLKRLSFADR